MYPVKNVNVFYVTSVGVTEVNKFLIFTSSHNQLTSLNFVKEPPPRHRTYSLPATFDSLPSSIQNRSESCPPGEENVVDDAHEKRIRAINPQDHCHNYLTKRSLSVSALTYQGNGCYAKSLKKKKKRREPKIENKNGSFNITPYKSLGGTGVSLQIDGYQLSYFIAAMKASQSFRTSFIQRWAKTHHKSNDPSLKVGRNLLVLVAIMAPPQNEVLDLLGNKMVNSKILYRRSLEHALSWLSTLGGAFSALGDLSPSYAEEAGHVSFTQLRIAMKLEDPGIQSRCRLFAAISLLQKGYLKSCRDIVKREYNYAISLPEGADPRLRNMCLGIWAKLQHQWEKAKLNKEDKQQEFDKTTENGLQFLLNNAKYWNVYNLEENRKIVKPENTELYLSNYDDERSKN